MTRCLYRVRSLFDELVADNGPPREAIHGQVEPPLVSLASPDSALPMLTGSSLRPRALRSLFDLERRPGNDHDRELG